MVAGYGLETEGRGSGATLRQTEICTWVWFFPGDLRLWFSGRMIPLVLGIMMLLKIQVLVSEALLKGLSMSYLSFFRLLYSVHYW